MYKKVLVVVTTLATLAVGAVLGQSAFAAETRGLAAKRVAGDNAAFLSLVTGAPLHEYTIRVTVVVQYRRVVGVSGTYLHCDSTGAGCTVDAGLNMFTAAIKGLDPQAVAAVAEGRIDGLAYNGGQGEATDRAIADMYKRSLRSAVAKARARNLIP